VRVKAQLLLAGNSMYLRGALEGLGHYIEATGAVGSSRRFHCSDLLFPMEYSTGIDRSCGVCLPLESMLLEPPNRCLGGLDRSYMICRIEVVESNGIPRRHMEDNSTPMQPA